MRGVIGLIILFLMFALPASAQESAMYKSDDGLLVFQYPAAWTQGEASFGDEGYRVPFTLADAEITIRVVNEDAPETFFEAQRKDSDGWVTQFRIGDAEAIGSTLTSGDYQIAFALDDAHVVVAVISGAAAADYEQAVVEVLATLRLNGGMSSAARIASPVLNIALPAGWESASSQMQGDYFQFVVLPGDPDDERYILIEMLDLAARGLLEVTRSQGVGALMAQLPGAELPPETLTAGGFQLARARGFNETASVYVAYTLFVAEESWLVAISVGASTEDGLSGLLADVDAIIAEMESGIRLAAGTLEALRAPTIEGVEYFPNLDPTHVRAPVDYPQTPPVGGPHHPTWQTCGVYKAPIVNEHAVHSLEHGAVWITYQPDLPAAEVEALANITRRGTHRILSPYPGIDSPIILSAWGYQLKLERSDDPRLMEFLLQYEQGATTPELGATCSGGETRTAKEIGS
jgi:hypothetical protein